MYVDIVCYKYRLSWDTRGGGHTDLQSDQGTGVSSKSTELQVVQDDEFHWRATDRV